MATRYRYDPRDALLYSVVQRCIAPRAKSIRRPRCVAKLYFAVHSYIAPQHRTKALFVTPSTARSGCMQGSTFAAPQVEIYGILARVGLGQVFFLVGYCFCLQPLAWFPCRKKRDNTAFQHISERIRCGTKVQRCYEVPSVNVRIFQGSPYIVEIMSSTLSFPFVPISSRWLLFQRKANVRLKDPVAAN